MSSGGVNYMCSWVEHSSYFFSRITALRHSDLLTDVTITCGDKAMKAHRLVLCASSEYFRQILVNNTEKSAYVHIMGVSPIYIQNILQYLYTGQIEIAPSDVEPFLKVANELKICGLSKSESSSANNSDRNSNAPAGSDYNLDLTLLQSQMKDYAKTDGSSSLPGDQALPPGSPAVVLPDGQVIPPSPSLASTLIRSNSASPFQPTLANVRGADGEDITIVPDIVEMSDNYEYIKEDSKENIAYESDDRTPAADANDTRSIVEGLAAEEVETGRNKVTENKTVVNDAPTTNETTTGNKFKLSLSSLAIDPAHQGKRKGLNDLENLEKKSKLDTPNVCRSGTASPQLSPVSAFPGLNPVNCRKGHSGKACKHAVLRLPDGRRVHFNKQEYENWQLKNSNDPPLEGENA